MLMMKQCRERKIAPICPRSLNMLSTNGGGQNLAFRESNDPYVAGASNVEHLAEVWVQRKRIICYE